MYFPATLFSVISRVNDSRVRLIPVHCDRSHLFVHLTARICTSVRFVRLSRIQWLPWPFAICGFCFWWQSYQILSARSTVRLGLRKRTSIFTGKTCLFQRLVFTGAFTRVTFNVLPSYADLVFLLFCWQNVHFFKTVKILNNYAFNAY